jgi:hypothetical protein
MIELKSTITCPGCGHRWTGTMPTDACQYLYVCEECAVQVKPKKGDCCVYCSYGDVPCSANPGGAHGSRSSGLLRNFAVLHASQSWADRVSLGAV